MTYRVLLVEGDGSTRSQIIDYFFRQSCGEIHVEPAKNAAEAAPLLFENEYDMVLMNHVLPDSSGLQLCKKIRTQSNCPVIFLSEHTAPEEILKTYSVGGDDCILKPFAMEVLFAKSRALLKRSRQVRLPDTLVCGHITLDSSSMHVYINGTVTMLPRKEYDLLKALMERPERVLNREQLLTIVWGYDYDGNERVIDNHIKNLRKYLGDAAVQLRTVVGRGYVLTEKTL